MGDLNKKLIVIENFLPNLDSYLSEIHKIDIFDEKTFNDKFKTNQTWPGKRSNLLNIENTFLFHFIMNIFNKQINIKRYILNLYLHLRIKEDEEKDWIHKDNNFDHAFLIYLNEDNINSGTYIYDDDHNMIADIKYIKNRFIMYSANYNHKGYGYFGNNQKDGRLTINGFVKEIL